MIRLFVEWSTQSQQLGHLACGFFEDQNHLLLTLCAQQPAQSSIPQAWGNCFQKVVLGSTTTWHAPEGDGRQHAWESSACLPWPPCAPWGALVALGDGQTCLQVTGTHILPSLVQLQK